MHELESVNSELYRAFNEINYFDEPHKYYVGKDNYVSVTTLIHKYQEPFDSQYWSNKKATEFNLKQREILRAWNFINKKGTMKGSLIHDYAENKLLNKIFRYPEDEIIREFGFDPIRIEYDITKKHVDNFIEVSRNKLIPVRTEVVVFDRETKIAGMADLLFYNVKEKELQIWDHKTNKKFSEKGTNNLNGVLCTLEDSDLEIYSLQLSLYKRIIERNTNLKLGKSHIVWYSHNNDNFKIIPTKNRDFFVNLMIEERIRELKVA